VAKLKLDLPFGVRVKGGDPTITYTLVPRGPDQ
jgi:hypothetical protein